MEPNNSPPTPTNLILISVFWFLVGTFIISLTSRSFSISSHTMNSIFGIIPFMIGILLIMVGWGLLTFRKWAYYTSLVLSILGTAFLFFINAIYIGLRIISDWEYLVIETLYMLFIPLSFFLLFICMIVCLIKDKKYFETQP